MNSPASKQSHLRDQRSLDLRIIPRFLYLLMKNQLTVMDFHRGKTRLAKWYAPYSVSIIPAPLWTRQALRLMYPHQDEEKIKLKGEVRLLLQLHHHYPQSLMLLPLSFFFAFLRSSTLFNSFFYLFLWCFHVSTRRSPLLPLRLTNRSTASSRPETKNINPTSSSSAPRRSSIGVMRACSSACVSTPMTTSSRIWNPSISSSRCWIVFLGMFVNWIWCLIFIRWEPSIKPPLNP